MLRCFERYLFVVAALLTSSCVNAPAPVTRSTDEEPVVVEVVEDDQDFRPNGNANMGEVLFKFRCSGCHRVGGGPDLSTRSFASEGEVRVARRVIEIGRGEMPAFEHKLTAVQITDLLTYLHTWREE